MDKCNGCAECTKACKMNIDVVEKPNSMECIRCGDCLSVCKTKALSKVKHGIELLH